MRIASCVLALALTVGVGTSFAAKCTTTIERPDGTKTTTIIQGDTCSIDLETGLCTCS